VGWEERLCQVGLSPGHPFLEERLSLLALAVPTGDGADGAQVPLADRIEALCGPGGRGSLAGCPGRLRGLMICVSGPVSRNPAERGRGTPAPPTPDHAAEVDRQSHEARDPRDVAPLEVPGTNGGAMVAFPTVVSGLEGPPNLGWSRNGARLIPPHACFRRPCFLRCRGLWCRGAGS